MRAGSQSGRPMTCLRAGGARCDPLDLAVTSDGPGVGPSRGCKACHQTWPCAPEQRRCSAGTGGPCAFLSGKTKGTASAGPCLSPPRCRHRHQGRFKVDDSVKAVTVTPKP